MNSSILSNRWTGASVLFLAVTNLSLLVIMTSLLMASSRNQSNSDPAAISSGKVAGIPTASLAASSQSSAPLAALSSPISKVQPNFFQLAVNQALEAARLTQSARKASEWNQVENHWQAAVLLMQQVPRSHTQWEVAQTKVVEYQRNLSYAQDRSQALAGSSASTAAKADLNLKSSPLFLQPSVADQAEPSSRNWLQIATTENQEVLYLDLTSVWRNQPYVEFWQRTYKTNPEGVSLQDQRLLANCQTGEFQQKEAIIYRDNQVNHSSTIAKGKITPGSAQANILSVICGQPFRSTVY